MSKNSFMVTGEDVRIVNGRYDFATGATNMITIKGSNININWTVNKTPEIKKVIFNKPATIVYWNDGTKTVVKKQKQDGKKKFDKEKGLAMAIAKKALGNEGNYYEVFKKWCED